MLCKTYYYQLCKTKYNFVCIYDNDLLNLYHKKEKSVTLHPYTLQPRKGRGAEAEAPNIANILFLLEGWRFGF